MPFKPSAVAGGAVAAGAGGAVAAEAGGSEVGSMLLDLNIALPPQQAQPPTAATSAPTAARLVPRVQCTHCAVILSHTQLATHLESGCRVLGVAAAAAAVVSSAAAVAAGAGGAGVAAGAGGTGVAAARREGPPSLQRRRFAAPVQAAASAVTQDAAAAEAAALRAQLAVRLAELGEMQASLARLEMRTGSRR